MADVFDIDGGYHQKHSDNYNRSGWTPIDTKSSSPRKDPRLARRDDGRKQYSPSSSPQRGSRGHPRQSVERSASPPAPPPPKSLERDSWPSPQTTQHMTGKNSAPIMYHQPPPPAPQQYQQPPPPPPMYSNEQYNSGYGATSVSYQQHGYQQTYQQQSTSVSAFNQYATSTSYPQQSQGYNTGQPIPPGDEYPGGWAPVAQAQQAYHNMGHMPPAPRPGSAASTVHTTDSKNDDLRKEAIAQEVKTQRATLHKQREDYLRKATVLRRELEKLRLQKHELLSDKSPPRDSARILRENAKLQLEIQNKLKSINNVVDMLAGIIGGDGLKAEDAQLAANNSSDSNSPKQRTSSSSSSRKHSKHSPALALALPPPPPPQIDSSDSSNDGTGTGKQKQKKSSQQLVAADGDRDWPRFNYVHYDPELHWCRVCDVFPRSAKDLLNHLHSAEHRQVTQEHQLVDTPWHKLPTDPELPSHKGAPVKRLPIKGLQFFISATAWYCKLCDGWIGDLHCASLHLKSKNHAQNYSNFVEQNPHWEVNWLKDREKAYARCAKVKQDADQGIVPPAPEPPCINEKSKHKKQLQQARLAATNKDTTPSSLFDSGVTTKEKKRKKKSKKRKKNNNSDSSSSSSSSSDSSTENDSDKAKSIRVAMRNKMRMQAQMILNEEIGGKVEVMGRLVDEERGGWKKVSPPPPPPLPQCEITLKTQTRQLTISSTQESAIEDNIINQWMTVSTPNNDKHILENLKGRLKQRQEADKEKAIEAAAEQRRRERDREERELKELRQREQREMEEKIREEREREQRDREEREQIKEQRERNRNRKRRSSESRSPDTRFSGRARSRSRGRSRSRSAGRSKQYRRSGGGPRSPPDRFYRDSNRRSPDKPPKPAKRNYGDDDEETHFDKHSSESMRQSRGKKSSSSSSSSRKLPFIGRMPLFKKRTDGEDKEIKKEDYEIRLSKFEPGNTARAFIPEPGVVHITKLATQPDPIIPTLLRINAENPPPPPKIIPEPPDISSENLPPPPPLINMTIEEADVQDMELDEAAPPLPPGVPVAEAKPLAKPAGNHLPRDFQDALNIIFPGDQRPEHLAAMQADPSLMLQYQYNMGYGMMPYPGMQQIPQYDYSGGTQDDLMKDESGGLGTGAAPITDKPDQIDDKEDLAMLGIDAADMAAQTF